MEPAPGDRRWELAGDTMGTSWSVILYAPVDLERESLRARIESELDGLVNQMSHWRPDSDLSRFSRAAPGEWVALPPDFFAVLRFALEVARRSGGAFDPTLASEADRWGFGPSGPRTALPVVPPALRVSRWREIEVDEAQLLARQPGGIALDLSAVAKGYAVDHLTALLKESGIRSCLVEIGGELKARGTKPLGQPWWVSIEPPPGSPCDCRIALSGYAIATSGDYRRFFEHEGTRYAHTIDPQSGAPLADPPASVSVIHRECMAADAWSTALMVLGVEKGLACCAEQRLPALFLHQENHAWRTSASRAFLEMLQ
jgi:thiamine biosynthesis lipoprotein